MTAELQRNLWLEISPTRLALMVFVLGAVFALAALADDRAESLRITAEGGFFAIVGVWGAFKASRAVTDEIRDRTWDFQRMSGLDPIAMALGKLFGATAYVWFGGLICMGVALISAAMEGKSGADLVFMTARMVVTGVLTHAAALAASIAGARRQRGHGRFDGALFVLAGLGAFWLVGTLFELANQRPWSDDGVQATMPPPIVWWGQSFVAQWFWLASVAMFAVLATLACWRLMRAELQSAPQPIWYAAAAIVLAIWVAGFGETPFDRAVAGFGALAGVTYATLWIEPKDVVGWRALAQALQTRKSDAGAVWPATLTGFGLCALAAIGVAITWFAAAPADTTVGSPLIGVAALIFIARDIAIFAFFHLGERQKRGDFAAVLTIVMLYGLGPSFLAALNLDGGVALFLPAPDGDLVSHIIAIASGLVQFCIVALAAKGRFEARASGLNAAASPA
jgi:hypothetical protein